MEDAGSKIALQGNVTRRLVWPPRENSRSTLGAINSCRRGHILNWVRIFQHTRSRMLSYLSRRAAAAASPCNRCAVGRNTKHDTRTSKLAAMAAAHVGEDSSPNTIVRAPLYELSTAPVVEDAFRPADLERVHEEARCQEPAPVNAHSFCESLALLRCNVVIQKTRTSAALS